MSLLSCAHKNKRQRSQEQSGCCRVHANRRVCSMVVGCSEHKHYAHTHMCIMCMHLVASPQSFLTWSRSCWLTLDRPRPRPPLACNPPNESERKKEGNLHLLNAIKLNLFNFNCSLNVQILFSPSARRDLYKVDPGNKESLGSVGVQCNR